MFRGRFEHTDFLTAMAALAIQFAVIASVCAQDPQVETQQPSTGSSSEPEPTLRLDEALPESGEAENTESSSDPQERVEARKVVVPKRTAPGEGTARANAEDVRESLQRLRDADLTPPGESSASDLVNYLNQMTELGRSLDEDFRAIRFRITQSQANVADQLLNDASTLSDDDFYVAAEFALAKRISDIPTSDSVEQAAITELVRRQVEIGLQRGLGVLEVRNAVRTVGYLERHAPSELAIEASETFGKLILSSRNRRFDDSVASILGTERRLSLVGKKVEVSGMTISGEPFDWSEYQGKVVLINFWASWSATCLTEIPQLKRLHTDYREKGFEIVGIGIDNSRARMEAVIAKQKIPWVNLWNEGSPQQHPIATRYGVATIPTGFLVNEEGVVVSTRARGAELRKEIYRLLGPASFVARDEAAQQRWDQAADELKLLIEREPDNIDYRVALGAIQLRAGRPSEYANVCAEAWLALGGDEGEIPARVIPLFCLSSQHALNPSLILAEASRQRSEADNDDSRLAVLMAAYRAGDDQLCTEIPLDDANDLALSVGRLFQSLAARRMGDDAKATQWLRQGQRTTSLRLTSPFLGSSEDEPYEHWICWLVADLVQDDVTRQESR